MPNLSTIDPDLREQLNDLLEEPQTWLDTPNDHLGGKKPGDLLGTGKEQLVRDLLNRMRDGFMT